MKKDHYSTKDVLQVRPIHEYPSKDKDNKDAAFDQIICFYTYLAFQMCMDIKCTNNMDIKYTCIKDEIFHLFG